MAEFERRHFLAATGALIAAPFAWSQSRARAARLGFMPSALADLKHPFWQSLVASLNRYGWREGIELSVSSKSHNGDPARALAIADEFVANKVDLILAVTTLSAIASKKATKIIPIVSWCGYPVETGLAESLARPGGNVTGVVNYADNDIWAKFVELLRNLKPQIRELGVLWDYTPPGFPDGLIPLPVIEAASQRMGIRVRTWMVRREQDLGPALAAIEGSSVDALVLTQGGGVHAQPALAARIGDLIIRRQLPAIVDVASASVFEQANCVLAYSPNIAEIQDRLAHLVNRVLRGANPKSLPFEMPAKFDLAVNAKAAKAMSMQIPRTLLLRADRVIE